VLNKIFGSGLDGFIKDGISNEKYRAIAGCPRPTATRDLKDLVQKGLFYISGGGKYLKYNLNLVERNQVFNIKCSVNISGEGNNRVQFIEKTLDKMLSSIQRNLYFHQDPNNEKLLLLIDNYRVLAEDNNEYLNKLKVVISPNESSL